MNIDKTLQSFNKCDVFTPEKISKIMASYLHTNGNLLEPSVGIGSLLKYIQLDNYESIDIFDIKQEYLDKCPQHPTINAFNEDFVRKEFHSTYKNIILNPPYIKIQDLSEEYRSYIKSTWTELKCGNLDIYYAFIMKCLSLLSDDGIMVAITPNSYLYNKSSKNLRKYLIEHTLLSEIIDYKSEKVFENVSTYCCITVFTKTPKDTFTYNNQEINYKTISTLDYNIFISETTNQKTIGDICSIRNGIATLRDKIYIHKTKLFNEPCWKPITSGSNDSWCIFPYTNEPETTNIVVIQEDTFKKDNPQTYNYLLTQKDELAKRDKGKKTYPTWYAYGRTQSLKLSSADKVIYVSTFADPENIVYTIDTPKIYIGCLAIEVTDTSYDNNKVKRILENNSDFIIKNSSKRGGGWLNMSSRILKQIPLPIEE